MKNTIFFYALMLVVLLLLASCKKDQVTSPSVNSVHPIDLTVSPSPVLTYKETLLIASPTNEDKENLTVLWSSKKGTILNSNEGFLIKWKAPLYAGKDTLTAAINNGSRVIEQKFEVDVAFGCGTPIMYKGKSYNTVLIGDQCWFQENLDVGIMVKGKLSQSNDGVIEKYCVQDNQYYCDKYGGLYQWNEAVAYNLQHGAQGICPDGWHIPTNEDFEKLKETVYTNGNSLKAIGEGVEGGVGTNTSGFSMLMAGYRSEDGFFWNVKYFNSFWSSTNTDATTAIALNTDDRNYTIRIKSYNKESGFSVRCIQN